MTVEFVKNKGVSLKIPKSGEYRSMEWYVKNRPQVYEGSPPLNPEILKEVQRLKLLQPIGLRPTEKGWRFARLLCLVGFHEWEWPLHVEPRSFWCNPWFECSRCPKHKAEGK